MDILTSPYKHQEHNSFHVAFDIRYRHYNAAPHIGMTAQTLSVARLAIITSCEVMSVVTSC